VRDHYLRTMHLNNYVENNRSVEKTHGPISSQVYLAVPRTAPEWEAKEFPFTMH